MSVLFLGMDTLQSYYASIAEFALLSWRKCTLNRLI